MVRILAQVLASVMVHRLIPICKSNVHDQQAGPHSGRVCEFITRNLIAYLCPREGKR